MGQVIEFPVARTLQPTRRLSGAGSEPVTAEIILFSGVRYSELEEVATKPAPRQRRPRKTTKH